MSCHGAFSSVSSLRAKCSDTHAGIAHLMNPNPNPNLGLDPKWHLTVTPSRLALCIVVICY